MKGKKKIGVILLLFLMSLGTVLTDTKAQELGTQAADDFSKRMKENPYVQIQLGGGYLGKRILYDTKKQRTLVYPNDKEQKTVIRKEKDVTVFYGKYRGKETYKNALDRFPELEWNFFQEPLLALNPQNVEISEANYEMWIEDAEKIEPFYTALSYAGILDNEMFEITAVEIVFDEQFRVGEVRFHLASEVAQPEHIAYLETQLYQKIDYIDAEEFEQAWSEVEQKMDEIQPLEDVEVIDYIDELSNVVKMVDEHFLVVLQAQTKELEKISGWDKRAVFAYLEAVDNKFGRFSRGYEGQQISQEEYLDQLDRVYQTAHLTGSDVYTYMFESSELKPKKKALLVIEQLGGHLDSNGMLQLEKEEPFYMEMTPHSEFLEAYAATVRAAYKKKNNSYRQLDDQMIHQFRMYIDRHNISYVRSHFEGSTDYGKLLNYAKQFGFSLYYGEPSRHHNKIAKSGKFKEQTYDKILTPNRLSEFIVNVKTGEFVTEWDVLEVGVMKNVVSSSAYYSAAKEAGEKKIVDTESFNYAPADYVEAHEKLDVLPASPSKKKELYLENSLKKKLKELWKSPDKKAYKEKYRLAKDYLQ